MELNKTANKTEFPIYTAKADILSNPARVAQLWKIARQVGESGEPFILRCQVTPNSYALLLLMAGTGRMIKPTTQRDLRRYLRGLGAREARVQGDMVRARGVPSAQAAEKIAARLYEVATDPGSTE